MARRHGCQQPFNLPQVACVIIFFLLAAGFCSISVPVLLKTWEVATVSFLYTLAAIAAASLFLYTSMADPSEYGCAVLEEGKTDEEQFYCVLCQIHVKKQSKHCRSCDRCVDGFDHHCKWLNNCVGKKNYWSFFSLVTSTCIMITVQFATGVYLFVISFTRSEEVAVRLTDLYGSGLHLTGFRAVHGVFCGLCIPPAILLGELLFFHIILQYKGMTTYDYIMAQSEAKTQALNASQEAGGKQSKWKLKIFQAGGVSTATNSRKVRVGINPLALLKMDRTEGGGLLACGCGSAHPRKGVGSIHPSGDFVPEEMPSPGPKMQQHPFSATLEDQSSVHLKAGRPAAEAEESAAHPLMQVSAPDLAKHSTSSYSFLSKTPSSVSVNNSKFSLPPIRPPKPTPAFDSL